MTTVLTTDVMVWSLVSCSIALTSSDSDYSASLITFIKLAIGSSMRMHSATSHGEASHRGKVNCHRQAADSTTPCYLLNSFRLRLGFMRVITFINHRIGSSMHSAVGPEDPTCR